MSILSLASGASTEKGYAYYTRKHVLSFRKLSADEYSAEVTGTQPKPYRVRINTAHVRQSRCNCPYADGRRIICKHMVALYFTAFPEEADTYGAYLAAIEAQEREEQRLLLEHYAEIKEYVKSLSLEELQNTLYEALIRLDELDPDDDDGYEDDDEYEDD